jgi:hypothetical protein
MRRAAREKRIKRKQRSGGWEREGHQERNEHPLPESPKHSEKN